MTPRGGVVVSLDLRSLLFSFFSPWLPPKPAPRQLGGAKVGLPLPPTSVGGANWWDFPGAPPPGRGFRTRAFRELLLSRGPCPEAAMLPAARSHEATGMALTPEAKAKPANPFSISSILSRSEPKRQPPLLCWEPGLLAKPTPWYPWVPRGTLAANFGGKKRAKFSSVSRMSVPACFFFAKMCSRAVVLPSRSLPRWPCGGLRVTARNSNWGPQFAGGSGWRAPLLSSTIHVFTGAECQR